jgi:ferredoxin, 2Fe-2S
MLGFAATAQPNSRLSCQISMTEALNGLIVSMPEAQH